MDDASRHIGTMAQDFHTAFGVGNDDRHIATIDADGVALAAIEGLYERVLKLEAENRRLRVAVADIQRTVKAMGRENEAVAAFASLLGQPHGREDGAAYLGPSYIRQAEIYEQLGEPEKAVEYYGKLLRLWRDCDPELVPLREDARAHMERLMREPVG